MDQYIGKLLDNRYEIIERIGTGGMAVVYKGRDHRLNRPRPSRHEEAAGEELRCRFYPCLRSQWEHYSHESQRRL